MFFGDDSKTLCFGRGQKCLIVLKHFLTILIREANWSRELDAAPGFIASNLDSDCSVSQKKPPHCPNKPPHLYIPKIKLRILSNSGRNQRFTMLLINEEHSNSTGNTQESISSVPALQFSKKSPFLWNPFKVRHFVWQEVLKNNSMEFFQILSILWGKELIFVYSGFSVSKKGRSKEHISTKTILKVTRLIYNWRKHTSDDWRLHFPCWVAKY